MSFEQQIGGHRYGMLEKTAIAAGICILLITIFASWSPADLRPTTNFGVGQEHVAAFGLLGGCWGFAFPRRAIQVLLVLTLIAVVLEAGQIIVPGRHARLIDVATKIVGGGAGVLIAQAICKLAQQRVTSRWQEMVLFRRHY